MILSSSGGECDDGICVDETSNRKEGAAIWDFRVGSFSSGLPDILLDFVFFSSESISDTDFMPKFSHCAQVENPILKSSIVSRSLIFFSWYLPHKPRAYTSSSRCHVQLIYLPSSRSSVSEM